VRAVSRTAQLIDRDADFPCVSVATTVTVKLAVAIFVRFVVTFAAEAGMTPVT
jgi:hypothetical protein